MYSFSDTNSHASDTLIATPTAGQTNDTYQFEFLEYPDVYIPNRTLAWTLVGLPEDDEQKQKLRRQIDEYNRYLHSLTEIKGFVDYFKTRNCCVSKSEISEKFSPEIVEVVFSRPKCVFATDLVIFHDYLFDASVNVDYKVTIDETDVILPVGKDATAYPASISGKKAIWNWVEHGHDFCFYIWDILGGRMNRDEDDTESEPSYCGFDAYDQYRGENAEPQLVKIFHKLESLGYIKTFTINPDDGSPRWVYYGKPNGSIDVALVDMTFLKNKLVTEQIEVLLWSTEADIMGKPYLLTDSNNKQFLSATPGNIGGHKKLKIYGRLDCPSAARHIADGKYVQHRVFFTDEKVAVSAGYRPCAKCMPEAYRKWKAEKEEAEFQQNYWSGYEQGFYQ